MGILTDKEISSRQESGSPIVTSGFVPANVKDVFVDLTVGAVITKTKSPGDFELLPGMSAIVKTAEEFSVPDDCVAFVHERTSVFRTGVSVSGSSPLKPGFRGACFVRVTNMGDKAIRLAAGNPLAQICFFEIGGVPEMTYDRQPENHFQDEIEYRGLGGYGEKYSAFLSEMEKRKNNLERLQGRIYADVVAILGIFSAFIAVLVSNVQAFSADKGICDVVLINAAIIASVGLLLVFIWLFLNGRK